MPGVPKPARYRPRKQVPALHACRWPEPLRIVITSYTVDWRERVVQCIQLPEEGESRMANLRLSLACGPYDRTQALIAGTIRPDVIDITYLPLQPAEIFWRMLQY